MKIVILAAGIGTRLGGHDLPKPLTLLSDGKSILFHQLEQIKKVASLQDVIIVVGYHKEAIVQSFPSLCFVENIHYASNNTAKSLLCGLKDIQEDVIWINGDVVFHENILKQLISMQSNVMVVNHAPVAAEEVKYVTDGKGHILNVSKTAKNGEGEALGINRFQAHDLPVLIEQLRVCAEKDYFEYAVEQCIHNGIEVITQVVGKDDCTEIDFPEDLERANILLEKWQSK